MGVLDVKLIIGLLPGVDTASATEWRQAKGRSDQTVEWLSKDEWMAEERVVGIDLGTTNSLVAYMQGETPAVIPGEDGDRLVPSVVAIEANGAVVGNAARGALLKDASSVVYSAKRLMGRGVEDISEEL